MRISLMTLSLFPSLRAQAWIALHQGIYSHLWWSEKVTQSCPTLCDPVDCSPPDSSVHGILQARILEWVAISFSRGSSQPRDPTWVSCIAVRRFILWAPICSNLLIDQKKKEKKDYKREALLTTMTLCSLGMENQRNVTAVKDWRRSKQRIEIWRTT